jgi:hypothetical protein
MLGKEDYVAVKTGGYKRTWTKETSIKTVCQKYMLNIRSHILVSRLCSWNLHLHNLKTVLPAASETRSVCVCTAYQNVSWCLKDAKWLNWWQIRILSSLHTTAAWE